MAMENPYLAETLQRLRAQRAELDVAIAELDAAIAAVERLIESSEPLLVSR